MKKGRRKSIIYITACLCLLSALTVKGQDKSVQADLSGYISSMQTMMFDDIRDPWMKESLLHNRLNFKLYAGSSVTFALDIRNRLFISDIIAADPSFPDRMRKDRGFFDLTTNVFNEHSFLLNTMIDRLWIDISLNKVQLKAGRQRINWGQTFVWNPNDVFNAYSYFDIDYPEKPGSDALRLQIYPDYSSTIELAASVDSEDDFSLAGLYRFNKWTYDIQLIAGYINSEDIVFGTGWSGAIGSTSFRGEVSWFQPYENFSDTTGTGLFTLGFDRGFSGTGMIQVQAMYCNNPVSFSNFNEFYSENISAKDLAFSEFSLFGSITYPVNPLFNIGLSAMWFPDLNGFYSGPSADVSLAENLDFSFIWQHFNAKLDEERTRINLVFLRMKYNF